MNETQTQTPESAAEKYVPQHVLASEDNEDATKPLDQPAPAAEAQEPEANGKTEEKPEADPAEERRKEDRRREAARIGALTRQKYAEKARADALEQRLRDLEAQRNGGQQAPMTQEQLDQIIDQRAEQKAAAAQHYKRVNEWDAVGKESFGSQKFAEACQTVADMASPEQRQMLLQVAMDTDGGQKAIMELAENADEAEKILAMPPHKMAVAIAKLGAEAPPPSPKPVSNAPAPIRPPSAGRARGAPDPEHGSYDDYKKWSAGMSWRR